MAFPSSGGTRKSLARAYLSAINQAAGVKTQAQELKNDSVAGSISAKRVVDFATYLADAEDLFDQVSAVPGIGQYARDQINDQTLDVATEFEDMINEIVATRDWITTNFPQDGSGYLLMLQFDLNGRYTIRMLSTAATAGLRTQLDLLIATID